MLIETVTETICKLLYKVLQYSYSSYLSRLCLHDIGILFIEANGSGGQSIRYQIDPQKLNLQSLPRRSLI